ncbi:MAG TPA: accessory factor UbiK family protein [Steroidobacteraceae bacterium]|nr:accessory factor UbiK family protein [Steroidobacteraceae bacterium]
MDPFRIDELARKLLENVPPALRGMQQDLEANFRAVLRSTLGRLDLVTREEFDAQSKVLERTRAKAEALERRLHELEQALASLRPDSPASAPAPQTPGSGSAHP